MVIIAVIVIVSIIIKVKRSQQHNYHRHRTSHVKRHAPPDAMYLPLPSNATVFTESVCPRSVVIIWRECKSHKRMACSDFPMNGTPSPGAISIKLY